jgi:hypothetical protein
MQDEQSTGDKKPKPGQASGIWDQAAIRAAMMQQSGEPVAEEPAAKLPGNDGPPPLEKAPLAYENPAFLNGADGRLIRIVAEYLEPLARFRRENIQDTVVFFGSARFRGREEADHALELLENTGATQPAPKEEQPASIPAIEEGTASELQRKRPEHRPAVRAIPESIHHALAEL